MFENQLLNSILIVATTLIFVAIIMPFIKKIAFHINAIDVPNQRKVHTHPMPRVGGIGIFLGFLLGYILFGKQSIQMNSVLIGSFIIILTGLADDIKPVKARYKLLGILLAALVIVFYGNIQLTNLTAFGFKIEFGFLSPIITLLFIVACSNIINLIDGLDGLAGGISSIFFLTIAIICACLGMTSGLEFTLALIMLGSTLGFLVHNFYPAKIFAGDSGALFLGFIISVISLLGFKGPALISLYVPILVLAIPILDTLFAIIRRTLKHEKIYEADKQHIHHQLLGMQFSHCNTVLIIYAINLMFAMASIFYILNDQLMGIIIYIILLLILITFVLKTSIIKERKKK